MMMMMMMPDVLLVSVYYKCVIMSAFRYKCTCLYTYQMPSTTMQ